MAAAVAGGYQSSVVDQYGELRSVLVAAETLPAGEAITPRVASRSLDVRRIPARFVPANAIASPEDVVGREPVGTLSAGAYLTADDMRLPRSREPGRVTLHSNLSPVEIQVTGAGALPASGDGRQLRVDVVVTTEPNTGGQGRTYVAAAGVPLLGLVQAGAADGDPTVNAGLSHVATLGLTREQALELIDAESFARQIRLIPSG